MVGVLRDPVVHAAVALGVAILFAAAALHKCRDVRAFIDTLRNYRLLPDSLVALMAVVVIKAELLVAIGVLLPTWRAAAGVAAAGLLSLYALAIAINLARGRRGIDCGCLGPGRRQPISEWLLVRNACVIAVAMVLALEPTSRALVWIDAVSLLGCVTTLSVLWLCANRLIETWPRLVAMR